MTATPLSAARLQELGALVPADATSGDERELILLGLPDVNGAIRGKALRPAAFAEAVAQGTVITDLLLALDPLDHPITDFADFGLRAGAGDLLLSPEPDTLRELSWRPGWQICLGTPSWNDGRPCELATREVLRRALADLAGLGFQTLAAFEYEIRIRDGDGRPLSDGTSYSVQEIGRFDRLLERLQAALAGVGVELIAVHTEAGPGLLELNLAARPGLRAADDAAYTKLAVKDLAATLGLSASFIAKLAPGEEGSSGHIHLSCWRGDLNAFAPDPDAALAPAAADAGLAPAAAGALAGMLEHLPAASLALNPTINSYKRLVPGWFAPVNASWGYENRSAALRMISGGASAHSGLGAHGQSSAGSAASGPGEDGPGRGRRCRIECRRPGADANPYLALAVLAAAAADGLRRGATPPPPVTGDASVREDLPALPSTLESALTAWQADGELRGLLGEDFANYFATTRAWELRAWQQAVSDWERERYERTV